MERLSLELDIVHSAQTPLIAGAPPNSRNKHKPSTNLSHWIACKSVLNCLDCGQVLTSSVVLKNRYQCKKMAKVLMVQPPKSKSSSWIVKLFKIGSKLEQDEQYLEEIHLLRDSLVNCFAQSAGLRIKILYFLGCYRMNCFCTLRGDEKSCTPEPKEQRQYDKTTHHSLSINEDSVESLSKTELSSSDIFSSFSRNSSVRMSQMSVVPEELDICRIKSVGDIGVNIPRSQEVRRKQRRRSSTMTERIVEVTTNYKADSSDCMNLHQGDAVLVVDKLDNEKWWIGKKIRSESTGLFPVSHTAQPHS